jgi:ABC-2 type transport system permease protein
MAEASKFRYRANAIAVAVAVLGLLVVLNFIADKWLDRFKLDATDNKAFTITRETRGILKNLGDVVTVKAYISEKLPPTYEEIARRVKTILSEYRTYSNGKVKVEFIDPGDDQEKIMQASRMGIQPYRLSTVEQSEFKVQIAFMGLAFLYGDKRQVIPFVTSDSLSNLEYELTSSIVKVTEPKAKAVGFFFNEGEHGFDKDYQGIRRLLGKLYTVREVKLEGTEKVPADIDTLVVAGPKKVTARQQFEIDQYIMRGGRVIFLIDSISMPPGLLQASPLDTGLGPMLGHYGIKLGNDLVLDASRAMAGFQQQGGSFFTPYYFWPKLTRDSFSRDNPAVSRLDSAVFPWTQSLEPTGTPGEGVAVTALIKSSPRAWDVRGYYNLNPAQNYSVRQEDFKTLDLSLAATGKFTSFFQGKPVPQPAGAEEQNMSSAETGSEVAEQSPATRIVVIGNSDFIDDTPFLMQYPRNATLFLNLVDWMTLSPNLIGIRAKERVDRPLNVSPAGVTLAEVLNFNGVTMLVLVFGMVRYLARKRSRKILENLPI